jgi:hypothetical protein
MSRVFIVQLTSTLGTALEPISLAPVKNIPLQRVVNRLLIDVQERDYRIVGGAGG